MLALIQRVKSASVAVDGKKVGQISSGLLVYVGIAKADTVKDVDFVARKVTGVRIFEDDAGKLNLSVDDISGQILLVSNFTLQGNTKKGRRPSFDNAASGQNASDLFDSLVKKVESHGHKVQTGIFGADMKVESVNDGPINLIVDSCSGK